MGTNMKKRLLAWVLTVVMITNMIPVQAFAAETEDDSDHIHVEEVLPENTTGEDSVESSTEPTVEPETSSGSEFAVAVIDDAALATEANFQVDGNTYATLTDAIAAASAGSVIVLMKNYTLPAGTYTIPAGVTLQIPYNSANTLVTNMDEEDRSDTKLHCVNSYTTPTAYRTLTMSSGANIVVKGVMSLSAQQSAYSGRNGMPTGPVSFVKMESGSNITVENGGKLYAWGYIIGSGSVEAKSGATVFESFQLTDWRGGNATSGMVVSASTYHVFPMSQYYVQNIEVPLKLNAGAIEKAYMSTAITMVGIQGADLPFVGEDGSMFQLTDGYIIKDYMEGTGRLKIECYGNVSVTPITMEMQLVALIGVQKLNTADMVLGINGNMTVDIINGSIEIRQDLGLLPGSEFYIREGVTCTLTSGKKIVVYDSEDWGNYVGVGNQRYIALPYVPGGNGTTGRDKDALIQIDGTVHAIGGSIYTTTHGANIYTTGSGVINALAGTEKVVYQAVQQDNYIENGTAYNGWTEIPVNAAWLKNNDGSYTKITASDSGKMVYQNGRWHRSGCTPIETVKTAATCTTDGVSTYTCSLCSDENRYSYDAPTAALGHKLTVTVAVKATCTTSGLTQGEKCTRCTYEKPQEVVPAQGHQEAVQVKKQATCTEDGEKYVYCSRAGCTATDYAYTATIPATGHMKDDPIVENVVEATCTTPGSHDEVYYCTDCFDITTGKATFISRETITDKALGHDLVVDEAVEPTCTTTGMTEGAHCSRCEYKEEQTVVSALGHTEVIDAAVAPTCTTSGLEEGKHCSVCGEITVKQKTVAALGHDWNYDEWVQKVTKEPTCTEEGLFEIGFECNRCGDMSEDSEAIPLNKVAHTAGATVVENSVAATCTATGKYDNAVYCTVCKTEMSRETVTVPVKEHTEGESVIENEVSADCESKGSYDKVVYCTVCNKELSRKTITVVATGHTEEEIPAVSPKCTTVGYTAGVKCSECGEILTAPEEIPATGHTSGETIVKNNVDPTCIKAGSYDNVTYCSVCGEVAAKETITVAATGHTEAGAVKENVVPSDCDTDGSYDNVVYCSVCNTEISRTKATDPADGHVGGEVIKDNEVPATGSTDGSYEAVVKCTICGEEISRTSVVIPATGEHTPGDAVIENYLSATCTEDGSYEEVIYCTECNEEISRTTVIVPKTGHTKAEAVIEDYVAAKCETDGSYDSVVYCTVCKDADGNPTEISRETITVPQTGHTEDNAVIENKVDAKCETDGSYDSVVYCSVCNKELDRDTITIPGLDHAPAAAVIENKIDEKCETNGSYDTVVYCSVCNKELDRDTTVVPSLGGHIEGEEVRENWITPTCKVEGSYDMAVYCTTCGEELSRQVGIVDPKTDHTSGEVVQENVVDATCGADGSHDDVVYCLVCDALISRTPVTVSATGQHTADEGVQENLVQSTCTVKGSMEFVISCTVCDTELSRTPVELPLAAHKYDLVAGEDATCTQEGHTDGMQCTVCQEWDPDNKQEVIPVINHKNSYQVDAKESTCTETGLTAGVYCPDCDTWLTPQEEIALKPHTETPVSGREETCEIDGLTDGVQCSVCQSWIVKQETINEIDGHLTVKLDGKDATCTETGLTIGYSCDRCGKVLLAQTVIDMEPHQYEKFVGKEATCEEAGLTEGMQCIICLTWETEQEEIPAQGHEEEIIPAVAPTCEEVGSTEGKVCTVCEEVLVAVEEVPATGHEIDWENGRIDAEATCEEKGLTTYICAICKKEESVVELALGHELVTVPAQKPTYTEAGWEEYQRCTRDPENCFYSTYKPIPALGEAIIDNYADFIENLALLENLASTYLKNNYSKLSAEELVIKYIRTGVDRYNSMSWQAFAGSEDEKFAEYVKNYEAEYNKDIENYEDMMKVTGLKNLTEFTLPNGDKADVGHIFGTMDISYSNKTSVNHADVAGWAGDTVDLLTAADNCHIDATGKTVEELVEEIRDKIFLKDKDYLLETYNPTLNVDGELEGTFSQTDIDGDLDGFYIFNELKNIDYTNGDLTRIISGYMTTSLTNEKRAEYFLENRLDGVSLRSDVRDAVYNEYVANTVVSTLESTRVFENSSSNINNMRKAACYVFADYICKLAGDWVEEQENPYVDVYNTSTAELAPGITQKLYNATTADGKRLDYYIATADVTRNDVSVYVNYKDNDPYISQGKDYSEVDWAMRRVLDQANAAQARHSDPTTENYIPNFNVVAAVNGTGFNMNTGEPSDLLVMEGVVVHTSKSFNADFFGMKKDGTAIIGTRAEYDQLLASGELMEAISSFGTRLVKDGEIYITADNNYFNNRAPRTAIGITKTGKVVMLAIDGRQDDNGGGSAGAAAIEIAQIMLDAGCWQAINLDGGGSTTFVAKQPGTTELSVINSPSDGMQRSVASSLYIASTAPSSTEFDHAVVESDYTYLTKGSIAQLTARAVSATGNAVDMPEGVTWTVSDSSVGTINADGVFTATANGEVTVKLMLNDEEVGSKNLYVVTPNNIFFTKDSVNAIYGKAFTLPIKAVYDGKEVAVNESDITITVANTNAGTIDGFDFIGNEASGLRKVTATATLNANISLTDAINIAMFTEAEASFDFDNATGGDAQLAFEREVSNSSYVGNGVYMVQDVNENMVTSYTFAIDMSQIQIPSQLKDLTYMLPGADLEDASAWKFLLQLAERISNLTNVQAKLTFAPDMDVDYSNIVVTNEYFEFSKDELVFDEATNTLTIKMRWIDQGKPIDEDSANPLCIVTGIKLTPKDDAAWSADKKLKAINFGEISYDIYLGTSTLYSFSCKEENQKTFGLYPYENDADTAHPRGGHFMDTYKEFKDEYTLINSVPEGWVMADGGWAYYEDGERYTGISYVEEDDLYYDFGKAGINIGQSPYTGDYVDDKGDEYYIINGKIYKEGHVNFNENGWIRMNDEWRYYNPKTGIRENVTTTVGAQSCVKATTYTYVTESGAKKVYKKDAAGHEYAKQPDGTYVCSVCYYRRIELTEADVSITQNVFTYTGKAISPSTKVVAYDGYVLVRRNDGDYYAKSSNNINVGTASIMIHAIRPAHNVDHTAWRGNAAGSVTLFFEIRPDLPTDVKIVTKGSTTTLQWTAAKAPEVTYVIYKSTDGEKFTEYGTTTGTSYEIKAADKNAFFKIGTTKVGLDENGNEKVYESVNKTNAISTTSKTARPDIVLMGMNANGKPQISWSAADATVSGYRVYYTTDPTFGYYQTYNMSSTAAYYTHTTAVAETTYYYRIKFVYADGSESMFSNTVSVNAIAGTTTLRVKDEATSTLEWTKVDGAAKYTVYRADAVDGKYVAITTTTATTYKDTSATPGTTYYYKVVAISASGKEGLMSGVVAVHRDPVIDADVIRVAGATRYSTAFASANATKENMGVDKFSNIVIASGENFADALAGSYLAKVKNAPIIMANGKNNEDIKAYIDRNMDPEGVVYILGSVKTIPQSTENVLKGSYKVKRLWGATRYDTNIAILEETGVGDQEILVCSGAIFADCLSASAVGKPILLVDNKKGDFTDKQKEFLSDKNISKYYVIGGTPTISGAFMDKIATYGKVERISGPTRYETSVAIANRFFKDPKVAVMAYAENFPDGLSGGPLAMSVNAPLILTKAGKSSFAEVYVGTNKIVKGYFLGGANVVDDDTVKDIFNTDKVGFYQ